MINHLDAGVLRVQRRHAKKFSGGYGGNQGGQHEEDVEGYYSFKEMAGDIEALVNVVWVSGTRMYTSPGIHE